MLNRILSLRRGRTADLPTNDEEAYQVLLPLIISNQHKLATELLASSSCKFNVQLSFGRAKRSLLHAAANAGAVDCLSVLLRRGADVNIQDVSGITALHLAARNGHTKCFSKLIEYKANLDIQDNEGLSALHWLAARGHMELINLALEHSCKVDVEDSKNQSPLHVACQNGHKAAVVKLLEYRANVEMADSKGWTPLFSACRYGQVECLRLLLKRGAQLRQDIENKSPLDLCVEGSYVACALALVEVYPQLLVPLLRMVQSKSMAEAKVLASLEYLCRENFDFQIKVVYGLAEMSEGCGMELLSLSSSYDFLVNSFLRTLRAFLRLCTKAEASGAFSDSTRVSRTGQSSSSDTAFFRHSRSGSMSLTRQPHPFVTLDPLWNTLFRWYDMLGEELKVDRGSSASKVSETTELIPNRKGTEISNESTTTAFSQGRTVSNISSLSSISKGTNCSSSSGRGASLIGSAPAIPRSLDSTSSSSDTDTFMATCVVSSFSMPQLPTKLAADSLTDSHLKPESVCLTEETKQAVTALVESTPVAVRAILHGHSMDSQWWRGIYHAPLKRKMSRSPRVQKHEHWGESRPASIADCSGLAQAVATGNSERIPSLSRQSSAPVNTFYRVYSAPAEGHAVTLSPPGRRAVSLSPPERHASHERRADVADVFVPTSMASEEDVQVTIQRVKANVLQETDEEDMRIPLERLHAPSGGSDVGTPIAADSFRTIRDNERVKVATPKKQSSEATSDSDLPAGLGTASQASSQIGLRERMERVADFHRSSSRRIYGSESASCQSESNNTNGRDIVSIFADRLCATTQGYYMYSLARAKMQSGIPADFSDFVARHEVVMQVLLLRNPKLIFAHFGFLLESPDLLKNFIHIIHAQSFEDRREWFYENLYRQYPPSSDSLTVDNVITVSRHHIFESSCGLLSNVSPEKLKKNFVVQFEGEEGMGAGVRREFFDQLSRELLNPDYALFTQSADGSTFQPNPYSEINPDHLNYFRFAGRIIAAALYHKQLLSIYFTRSFYKHILGIPVDTNDVASIDPEYARNLQWILDNDISDLGLELTFSLECEVFGVMQEIELKPGGASIPVTDRNKHEYVQLVTEKKLTSAIQAQITHFLDGFTEIIPQRLVVLFTEFELELLMSGVPDIDKADWREHTDYQGGYDADTAVIKWFWEVVWEFDHQDCILLLQFTTGSSRVPHGGFCNLSGASGPQHFCIAHTQCTADDQLPTAATCFNMLKLPEYTTKEILLDRLTMALHYGSQGFEMA